MSWLFDELVDAIEEKAVKLAKKQLKQEGVSIWLTCDNNALYLKVSIGEGGDGGRFLFSEADLIANAGDPNDPGTMTAVALRLREIAARIEHS